MALTLSLSTACFQPKSGKLALADAPVASDAFPELLPRPTQLGSGQEQAEVQRIFSDLTQKISLKSADYRSRIQLAQLYMLEARVTGEHGHYYPAALEIIDGLLAENPPKDVLFGAKSLKASVLLSLHHFSEAKTLAEEAVQLNGYNALIYGSLVDAHVELGDYETAVTMADKMVSIRPDLRSYSRISYLRELHGDLEGAIDAMQRAAEAGYPGYEETAWCRLTLGSLFEQVGDLEAAQAQYEQILVERPNYAFAIAAQAGIAEKEGKLPKAEALLLQACELLPEVGFYESLAGLYQAQGKTAQAEKLQQEVLEMLADDEAHGHQMGLEYARLYLEQLDDLDQALVSAEKEYKARPNNVDVNLLMGAIRYRQGNFAAAQEHLTVAARLNTPSGELQSLLGLTAIQLGKVADGKAIIAATFAQNQHQTHAFAEEAKAFLPQS